MPTTSKAKIPDTEWFKPRSQAKPVPASTPALVPPDAVIIFYGVDSLRQDALTPAYRQHMPQIMKFRDEAISFDTTRAPGSQTIYTLTQIFTGTYFSQQYWSSAVTEGYTALWPHEEKATRFTEVLAKAGVPTVHYGQAEWFLSRYGMTSGFTDERWVEPPAGKRWSEMPAVTDAMIARLRAIRVGLCSCSSTTSTPTPPTSASRKEATPGSSIRSRSGSSTNSSEGCGRPSSRRGSSHAR
jgi:hypothetical protein